MITSVTTSEVRWLLHFIHIASPVIFAVSMLIGFAFFDNWDIDLHFVYFDIQSCQRNISVGDAAICVTQAFMKYSVYDTVH